MKLIRRRERDTIASDLFPGGGMKRIEVLTMSDNELVERIICESGGENRFSPELEELKEELRQRLNERHRRECGLGWWGTADPADRESKLPSAPSS